MLDSKIQKLSFGAFMQEWLYGTLLGKDGYYKQPRVGKNLDFYTNVSVGKIFGYCLGFYLYKTIQQNNLQDRIAIVEIGSEKGDLIADIAEFLYLYTKDLSNITFLTLEPFKSLQNLQKETFKSKNLNATLQCVDTFQNLKTYDFSSVLFVSNELLDAFACELISDNKMAFIKLDENLHFTLNFESPTQEILEIANLLNITTGEIPLNALSFVKELAQVAPKWLFLGFDYGDINPRNTFSLRFYKDHKTENLFKDSTLKYNAEILQQFCALDMTYDVNFSLWRWAFSHTSAKELFLHRQNRALVDMGLDEVCTWYIESFGMESFMRQSTKVRALISPGAFGERFFGFAFTNF